MLSITFKSGIKVSYLRRVVEGPHWEKGKDGAIDDLWSRLAKVLNLALVPYSKRAAVYLVADSVGPYDVEVKLKITKSKNVSGEARLIGTLSGVSIEGTCPSSAGEHTVSARITKPPEELRACRGRIAWRLDVDATPIGASLGSTFVEIYFILGRPGFRYRKRRLGRGVALLFGRVGVAGSDPNAVIASDHSLLSRRARAQVRDRAREGTATESVTEVESSVWEIICRRGLIAAIATIRPRPCSPWRAQSVSHPCGSS